MKWVQMNWQKLNTFEEAHFNYFDKKVTIIIFSNIHAIGPVLIT